jgi:hypothetical protein
MRYGPEIRDPLQGTHCIGQRWLVGIERLHGALRAPAHRTDDAMANSSDLPIDPKILLRDGRVIASIGEAIALLREHESRPGVDARDEVLHGLERAQTDQQRQAAAQGFRSWVRALDLLPDAGAIRRR